MKRVLPWTNLELLHQANLPDGRAGRSLFAVEVDFLQRDNFIGDARAAL
jgi:hypothetical protein